MVDHARARKLADRIKVIVAQTIEKRIKDPRLGFVTLTDVRVTGDLQHATIFYTVYGSNEDRDSSVAALASAKGMIRGEVGKNIEIRLTPTLEFILDALPESAQHMESLLRETRERDEAVARSATGAPYAGGPDPYKKPPELEPEEDSETASESEPAGDPEAAGDAGRGPEIADTASKQ